MDPVFSKRAWEKKFSTWSLELAWNVQKYIDTRAEREMLEFGNISNELQFQVVPCYDETFFRSSSGCELK